jgi:hypothetical protein
LLAGNKNYLFSKDYIVYLDFKLLFCVRKIQEVCVYGFGVETRSSLWYVGLISELVILMCLHITAFRGSTYSHIFFEMFQCLRKESYPSSQLMERGHFWIREGLGTIHEWDLGHTLVGGTLGPLVGGI